jgi:preprotein translocase subunit SecA
VILTEYHDSRRVDRQLVGRCARQGDPGSCEAIVSLEDEIFRTGAPRLAAALQGSVSAGVPVPDRMLVALRKAAQGTSERRQYAIRMNNLKQDRQLQRLLAFTGRSE